MDGWMDGWECRVSVLRQLRRDGQDEDEQLKQ